MLKSQGFLLFLVQIVGLPVGNFQSGLQGRREFDDNGAENG